MGWEQGQGGNENEEDEKERKGEARPGESEERGVGGTAGRPGESERSAKIVSMRHGLGAMSGRQ